MHPGSHFESVHNSISVVSKLARASTPASRLCIDRPASRPLCPVHPMSTTTSCDAASLFYASSKHSSSARTVHVVIASEADTGHKAALYARCHAEVHYANRSVFGGAAQSTSFSA